MRNPHNERLTSDTPESGPERKCILSGDHGARDGFIRLALSPSAAEGGAGPGEAREVLPDVLARAPGRGAWIGVSRAELETALAKGKLKGALLRAFGKSLAGTPLAIPADLPGRIEAALLRAFTDRLGLEHKAGRLLLGSDRIAEKARAGRVAWLGHAADAAEDGVRKLDQAFRVGRENMAAGEASPERGGVILPLDRAALSMALGRDNVVHLALTDSAAANRLAAPLQRLLRFEGLAQARQAEAIDKDATRQAVFASPPDATIPDRGRVQATEF